MDTVQITIFKGLGQAAYRTWPPTEWHYITEQEARDIIASKTLAGAPVSVCRLSLSRLAVDCQTKQYPFDGTIPPGAIGGLWDTDIASWTGDWYYTGTDVQDASDGIGRSGHRCIDVRLIDGTSVEQSGF